MDILHSLLNLVVILIVLFGLVMVGYFINRQVDIKRKTSLDKKKFSKKEK